MSCWPTTWTADEVAVLRREYPACADLAALAARLGKTPGAIKCRAARLGLRRRQPWTDSQRAIVRERYRRDGAAAVARTIGRTVRQVHQMAVTLGLSDHHPRVSAGDRATIRRLNAEGWSDAEIAAELGRDRHVVGRHRRRMGLADNAASERRRGRVREATAQQLEAAGIASLGELRAVAYRDFAASRGWPADLRPRAVMILHALAARGPMTRRQIALAIGMPWKGSRKSLTSNDPEGSYLANLAARGLVVRLLRAAPVTGQGKGRSCDLYTLSVEAIAILETANGQEPIGAES